MSRIIVTAAYRASSVALLLLLAGCASDGSRSVARGDGGATASSPAEADAILAAAVADERAYDARKSTSLAARDAGATEALDPADVVDEDHGPQPRGGEGLQLGPAVGNDPLMIYTLPIGAGNCQLMRCPSQNKIVMFDCGSTGAGAQGWTSTTVQQFLQTIANAQTEFTVSVSHADADHSNYIPPVFGATPVRAIVLGDVLQNYSANFQQWAQAQVQQNGAQLWQWTQQTHSTGAFAPLSCYANNNLDVGSGIMTVNAGTTKNDKSMVVGSVYGQFQAVFTGDMTATTASTIIDGQPITLAATDVITGAHHGADTFGSNDVNWTNATQPYFLMFSSGTRHNHPRCTAMNNYWPYIQTTNNNRTVDCGNSGGYIPPFATNKSVAVTNNNGIIAVQAYNNGNFNYTLQTWNAVAPTNAPPKPMDEAPMQ